MIIDCTKLGGLCSCGREHPLHTKYIVCEAGCMDKADEYFELAGLSGRRAVIYDSNTYNNQWIPHIKADQEIVLDATGLHTDKDKVDEMMTQLRDPEIIVAVGGGTITDFGRYSADKLGVPFVSVPTLVSADGFSANICSIIIDGQKKSIPMIAATLVLCDINIVSHVPMFLTMSGVCDIMSKYISLADWKISHIVSGEYICPEIVRMAEEALKRTRDCCMDLLENKTEAYEAMAASLMESGLTMQMLSNSRAASGAEHLIAHLAEMRPPRFEAAGGIHGECVGVGTVLMAERYHEMIAKKPVAKPFVPYDEAWIREKFGPLADGIIKENSNDILASFNPQSIIDHWDEIVEIVKTIPEADELRKLYSALGAKYRLEDIHIDPALKEDCIEMSVAIRNRLTFMRMSRVLDYN